MADRPSKRRGTSDGALVGNGGYERPKPAVTVDEKDLPAIKNWEVGKKYYVKAHVEMVSHSKGDQYSLGDETKRHEARLKFHKIEEDDSGHEADE